MNTRFNKTLSNEYPSPSNSYDGVSTSCHELIIILSEVRVSKKMVDAMRGEIPEGEVCVL